MLLLSLLMSIWGCRYEFPAGKLLDYGSCKRNVADSLNANVVDMEGGSSNLECIYYEYDGVKTLYFTHINADFNCCPDKIGADIAIKENSITVFETGDGLCDCICLYDLEYEIRNLEQGVYTFKIDNVDDLEFKIDLNASYSGIHCVDREGYPWK